MEWHPIQGGIEMLVHVVTSCCSLLLKVLKLERDLIVGGSRFHSQGAAQLNDLSSQVFLVLAVDDINETPVIPRQRQNVYFKWHR